ncbi:MAG TPA: hypothetical protein VNT99_06335 [Methylomirabilota bacterium]|nr:hypothetical protein [Methylomirabilota bacterium]
MSSLIDAQLPVTTACVTSMRTAFSYITFNHRFVSKLQAALGLLVILAFGPQPTSAAVTQTWVHGQRNAVGNVNGATSLWAFFTYTNVSRANFTNVAIITFPARDLSLQRRNDTDISLYVGNGLVGKNLFILDPAAASASRKSVGRGATKFVVFSNAQPSEVFFIGVKSEGPQAAMFSIIVISSDRPFSWRDASNNVVATAFPLPTDVPDGTPDHPGVKNLLALVLEPEVTVQRIYVTNSIFHEQAGDLIGILSHTDPIDGGTDAATLNNHRTWNGFDAAVYDDSDQGDLGDATSVPPARTSDGPGTLRDFVGHGAGGVWEYAISDNALFNTGRVEHLTLVIQPASTNADFPVDLSRHIGAGRWLHAAFDVPFSATNVQICVSTDGPVDLYARRGDLPTFALFDKALTNVPQPGVCLEVGLNDSPRLNPGRYYVGVYNSGASPVPMRLFVTVQRNLTPRFDARVVKESVLA